MKASAREVLRGSGIIVEKAALVKKLLFLIRLQIPSLNGGGFWWPERCHIGSQTAEWVHFSAFVSMVYQWGNCGFKTKSKRKRLASLDENNSFHVNSCLFQERMANSMCGD